MANKRCPIFPSVEAETDHHLHHLPDYRSAPSQAGGRQICVRVDNHRHARHKEHLMPLPFTLRYQYPTLPYSYFILFLSLPFPSLPPGTEGYATLHRFLYSYSMILVPRNEANQVLPSPFFPAYGSIPVAESINLAQAPSAYEGTAPKFCMFHRV